MGNTENTLLQNIEGNIAYSRKILPVHGKFLIENWNVTVLGKFHSLPGNEFFLAGKFAIFPTPIT